jgi:hypothetical protein
MAGSSPLSPRLDAALVHSCREAEERQCLRKAFRKQGVTSSTMLVSVAQSSTSAPNPIKISQECAAAALRLTRRLLHIMAFQASKARSIITSVHLANKYDDEDEINNEFGMPGMLKIWAECNCVPSSLAVHLALSQEAVKLQVTPTPSDGMSPGMTVPAVPGASGVLRVMQLTAPTPVNVNVSLDYADPLAVKYAEIIFTELF